MVLGGGFRHRPATKGNQDSHLSQAHQLPAGPHLTELIANNLFDQLYLQNIYDCDGVQTADMFCDVLWGFIAFLHFFDLIPVPVPDEQSPGH